MKGTKKRIGRPPSRPDNLVSFTAQLTRRARQRLKVLAELEKKHAYAVVETAFWDYWDGLPEDKRDAAEAIAAAIEKVRDDRS